MHRIALPSLLLAFALLTLAGAGPAQAASPAVCQPGDRPEPGVQGQVPRAVQGEESRKGFWCGMREVGRSDIGNRGGNYGHAWIGDCAYVSSFQGFPRRPKNEDPAGLAVIDVADPANPQFLRSFRTPASLDSVETVTARDAGDRQVLIAGDYDGNVIDVYDASDCRNPRLMKSFEVPYNVHNVTLSWDAKTLYYATALPTSEPLTKQGGPNVVAVDLTDLAAPKVLTAFALSDLLAQGGTPAPLGVHNVEVSPDGTRLYAGVITPGLLAPLLTDFTRGRGEMTILDVSEIHARAADPEVRFVSQFENSWHGPQRFERDGRTYLVSGDEAVNNTEPLTSCGGPFPRIADITDESAPKPIADVPLEINSAANCPAAVEDNLLYSTHYTDVDDQEHASIGLFPMYNAGLRVVDLRDPAKPVEIGYFNPGPDLDTRYGMTYGTQTRDAIDLAPSHVRYKADTGHIWFVTMTGGLHVVELSPTGAPEDLGLPPRPESGCTDGLSVKVAAPDGRRAAAATVSVDGEVVRSLRGNDLRAPVLLRDVEGRATVRVTVRTEDGRRFSRRRTYTVCAEPAASSTGAVAAVTGGAASTVAPDGHVPFNLGTPSLVCGLPGS